MGFILSLADFIRGYGFLKGAFKSGDLRMPLLQMFLTDATVYALSPKFKTASLQCLSHERNYI